MRNPPFLLTLASTTGVIGVLGATHETYEGRTKKSYFLMCAPLTSVVQAMLTLLTLKTNIMPLTHLWPLIMSFSDVTFVAIYPKQFVSIVV